MKNIVFLEGLPKVGKTSLLNFIKEKKLKNVFVADELLTERSKEEDATTSDFMINDIEKINFSEDGLLLIDRGPISTLSFNQTKMITDLNYNFDLRELNKWFNKLKSFYQQDNVFVYLLRQKEYRIREPSNECPHGTIENQKIMEAITLYNCKKYVKNLIIKDFSYDKIEQVANEIIDKFMC